MGHVPIIDSGIGKMDSKDRLNVSAITRVSSRCWLWSSPTGTSVDLRSAILLLPGASGRHDDIEMPTCITRYLLLVTLGRPADQA